MPNPDQNQQDPWEVVSTAPAPSQDSAAPTAAPVATPAAAPASANDPWAVVNQTPVPQPTGVLAGVKRNTVDALTGLYHAFNDPATEQEKTDILQKIRDGNSKGDKIPEDLATNPSKATLALHRIIDAPAATLLKKSRDEVGVAQDLINNHEYWKGGNLYLSGLADKGLSALPIVGPMVNSIAERAEGGDVSGAATDVASLVALEHAPAIAKAGGKAISRGAEAVSDLASKGANKINSSELRPEMLTKRPETPAPQHGAPVKVESPLDGPTVGKQLGGKDLSQEALDALQGHVTAKIPAGGTAKGQLMKAVEPVAKTISETASKMNDIVQQAPNFTTSVMQDSVFGEGKVASEIEAIKQNLPPSVKEGLSADVDAVMDDADKALNSNDPVEVLEYRRQLGKKIDWDSIEKNPTTPAEVQNSARAKVYQAIGNKIHAEVPETVELDKTLQPNLELRSHMRSKLGDRVVDDPLAATSEAQSELKKGQTAIDNAQHNETVARNQKIAWAVLAPIVGSAIGVTAFEKLKSLFE
jgi:hypothetical protein